MIDSSSKLTSALIEKENLLHLFRIVKLFGAMLHFMKSHYFVLVAVRHFCSRCTILWFNDNSNLLPFSL